jgi:hypothetical protein
MRRCVTSKVALKEIKSFFVVGVLSKDLRQLRYPDMSTPVFFLWGLLRTMMSKNKPSITDNIKRKITKATAANLPAMLAATFADVECPDRS